MCDCEVGSSIHYGVAASGNIDMTKGHASLDAKEPSTLCGNSVFGDPHYGIVKSCWCESKIKIEKFDELPFEDFKDIKDFADFEEIEEGPRHHGKNGGRHNNKHGKGHHG